MSRIYPRAVAAARSQVAPVLAFSLFANLLVLTTAVYMLQVFDRVLTSGSTATLFWLSVIALCALLVFGALEYARKSVLRQTGDWMEERLAGPFLTHATRIRARGSEPKASLSDLEDLRRFLGGGSIIAFFDAPWMPLFIAAIWLLHPTLGYIAAGGAVLLFALAVLNDRLTRTGSMRAASARRRGARDAQRVLDNAETVVPLGMTRGLVGNWLARHGDARDAGGRSARTTETLAELSKVVRLTLQIAVLGVGAFFVLQGQLTAGGMIAASIILARALSPVERSIGAWRAYLAAREAHGRLKDFFASVSDASRTRLPAPQGNVSVTNLWWGPENAVEQVLKGVSFHVEAGKTLGIIGPTGAGKTTLCRLLTGSWSPVLGRIRLDGASLSDWDPDQLSEYIGYLPQTVELFPGTVAQNIARMTEANDADVVAAAKLAGCHELVLQLPKGYETDVGLHGANLSGGQLQRIGLARAMFGNPKLLVFDEPNSNLDAEGEHALMEALARLKEEGRTVVLVAHQPSMLRTADSVLILRDGKVAAFGSREETLGKIAPNANGRQLSAKANKRSGAGKRADPDASAAAMIGE